MSQKYAKSFGGKKVSLLYRLLNREKEKRAFKGSLVTSHFVGYFFYTFLPLIVFYKE